MTTFLIPKNNAYSTLAAEINNAVTSLNVAAGEGARFPTSYPFHITIDSEILECSDVTTDTLTVTRAAESTSAAAHLADATVRLNITAQAVSDLNTAVTSLEGGIAGNLDDTAGGTDALLTKAPTSNAMYDGLLTKVPKSLFDAYTILMATDDNTPIALTVGEQTIVGRITGGVIAALTVAQLQTLWGSAALPENVEILLTAALSADGKWSGITEGGTAGAILAFGDLVYLQTVDSKWELANADNAAAGCSFKLGICVLAAAENAATKVLLYGKVRADAAFPALTIGAPVYMAIVAGDIQVAAPTATTDVVRVVGYGNTADELYFNPSQDWFELV